MKSSDFRLQASDLRHLPIGVFDSGIGGLTVLKGLLKELPNERFIYFGDTARVPYGTKSPEAVLRYSREICRFLLKGKGSPQVKMIVAACNTASALAVPILKKELPVPLIGVVEAGAGAAARLAPQGTIAIIGTKATIKSSIYAKYLKRLAPKSKILSQACPLFVPLVEEGWLNQPVTHEIARIYLEPLTGKKPDALILGCTHYPLLKETISRIFGPNTAVIDSPTAVAQKVKDELIRLGIESKCRPQKYKTQFFVSDDPKGFERSARFFLSRPILKSVRLIRL
ncbi:MAG: glutamate racemase [Elusimicrobia bacterium]|nr:glutamate racemase [Elusimicrobiota bacterium]